MVNAGIFETIYAFVDEERKYGDGKKIPGQEKYEGAYRARWGDLIVVGIDTNLVAFDPQANSPARNGTLLKAKGRDRFVMESRSNFDSPGEFARFVFDPKQKKAKGLVWGSMPLERLRE